MERADLERLSKDELIELVLRLQRPEKTSRTSSKPPSTAVYLKCFQALSYERLQRALSDLFGLTISQGGLMAMLRRAQARFAPGREAALSALRRAAVVACDETGVRIEGSNSYHWVFRCDEAVGPAFSDPQGRDSFGRGLDEASVARLPLGARDRPYDRAARALHSVKLGER